MAISTKGFRIENLFAIQGLCDIVLILTGRAILS